MSASKKKQQTLPVEEKQSVSLERFIHSSLFSEVYLFNDLPNQFSDVWENISPTGFYEFYDQLITILHSFSSKDAEKWNHTETLENLIIPLLNSLGHTDYNSENNSLLVSYQLVLNNSDGDVVALKPSVLVCEDESGKKHIKNATQNDVRSEIRKYLKFPVVTSYYGSVWDRKSGKYSHEKDELIKRGDVFSSFGPDGQIAEYLNEFDCSWGFFTDGYLWRLYRKEISNSDSSKYFEFDFAEFFNLFRTSNSSDIEEGSQLFEAAKYFYWFFSNEGVLGGTSSVSFLDSVFKKSQTYVDKLEDDLKERFVHSMTLACNGFMKNLESKGLKEDIKLISKTSESFVFNLIFLRSCESRRIITVQQDHIHLLLKSLVEKIKYYSYEDAYSSSLKLVKIAMKDIFGKTIKEDGYDIYNHIKNLNNMIENGDNGFGIIGYKESIFYPDEKKFYNKAKINNETMVRLLYQLFYLHDGKNYQIPYNLIRPRQLGSIYESFLEFQPEITLEKMYYVKKKAGKKVYWQWVGESKTIRSSRDFMPSVPPGGIIFTPNNKDRKTTGSYYTPEYIVDYIVNKTIGPLCKNKTVEEIQSLKLIDPAMGSGHFLIGALDYLSKKISKINGSSEDMLEIKRNILHTSIYGIDINPSAVKLCKMSLWLATASAGKELEHLEDQLSVGDSITGEFHQQGLAFKWKDFFKKITGEGGFDAVIGNPPYNAEFEKGEAKEQLKKMGVGESITNMNSANLFFYISSAIIKDDGKVGLIVPKSLYYSSTWEKSRNFLLPKLVETCDVSEAFKGVKLEQVIVIYDKHDNNRKEVNSLLVGECSIDGGILIEKDLYHKTGIMFSSYTEPEVNIVNELSKCSQDASSLFKLKRGLLLQSKINKGEKSADVFRCKTVKKFRTLEPIDYISKKEASKALSENDFIKTSPTIIQNIVAHVTKPSSQIVLMASNNKGVICLDNVSYILPVIDLNDGKDLCTSFFNSWFVSWYLFRFCYSKAVRTMRFDNCHLKKLPVNAKIVEFFSTKTIKLSKDEKKSISTLLESLSASKRSDNLFKIRLEFEGNIGKLRACVLFLTGLIDESKYIKESSMLIDYIFMMMYGLRKHSTFLNSEYSKRSMTGFDNDKIELFDLKEAA